jgi:hypothetical protein
MPLFTLRARFGCLETVLLNTGRGAVGVLMAAWCSTAVFVKGTAGVLAARMR